MPKKKGTERTEGTELSNDTKTIITILCLFFFYPLGLIFTWVWMNWPKWLKWIITLPLIAFLIGLLISGFVLVKFINYAISHPGEHRMHYQMESTSSSTEDYQ